jgi:PEP-CTERM motif-containing protein
LNQTGTEIARVHDKRAGEDVMKSRLLVCLAEGFAIAMVAIPAMAGTVRVPEPASMSLLAVGMGGAYVARKFFRRK